MASGSDRSSWRVANLNSPWHTGILVCFVAILSYCLIKLGAVLTIGPQGPWPLWFGNVVLASILLLVPRRIWAILMAAALAAFFLYDIQTGSTIRLSALLILYDTVEVLTAALCLSYAFGDVPRLNSVRALAKFSFFAVILAPLLRAFFVAFETKGSYWVNWRVSFFSEAVVYLTLMPAILGWFNQGPARGQKSRAYYLEAAALIAGLVVFGYLAFAAPGGYSSEARLYSLVPFLLWSALRFGSTGVSTSAIAIAVVAIWGATHGRGPFIESGPLNSVLSLQLFLFFAVAPFMVLAAVVEENKQASEQLFRSIFENAQLGIGLFKIDSQEHVSNRALQEMLGYPAEELSRLGQWDDIVPPDERVSCAQRYAELIQGRRDADEYEQRFIRRDGRIVLANSRFKLLRDPGGKPQYLVALTEDITVRKQAEADLLTAKEEAVAATQAKSDFLANMSHEIRTPMNAILGMTHLALNTELTRKQHDYLTKTKGAAQALLGIINDILDFSKIEAGKLDVETIEFRLDQVLDNLSSVVSQKAQDKNLEFLIAAQHDIPPNLMGDPLRLGQILINLVNNAVKFTDQGEVVVTVALEERVSERVKLKVSVRDSGIGMTPEQTARLFQAFSQADTSISRKYGGTGLGLSISKRLVELMGGEIWVESKCGLGSSFFFTAWFGIGSPEPEHERFIPDLAGVRALVIDDNTQACEILADALRAFALRVDSVSSGEDAVREIAAADSQDPYRLVLMDWHMPGMDGLEASRVIKRDDRLQHVPKIVMVTAFGREDIRTKAEKIGIDGFLLKPVNSSLLYDTLMDLFHAAGLEKYCSRVTKDEAHVRDATGIRILLVEDNEMNQQVATELLQSAGTIVTVANHGGEAVRILTAGDQAPPFDVVFMDLQMPEMDGFTAARLIRAQPRLQGLPIIAMTAHALVEEYQRCLDVGMNDHVSKPIDPEVLFSTLLRWAKPRRGPEVESQATLIKAFDDLILPEIAGINQVDGLKRVAGNKRLYRDLLAQFASKQDDAAVQISVALEYGDLKLAERIAHTVKGVAGNLGIGQVFAAAERLERAIHDSVAVEPAVLEEFSLVLSRQVRAISQAMPDVTPDQPADAKRVNNFDMRGAAAAIARLRALLESGDTDAGDAFPAVENILEGTLERSRLDVLSTAIREFDCEEALLRLDEIAEIYGGFKGED
jgi:two-component system sensor histidine kinase/response regulator